MLLAVNTGACAFHQPYPARWGQRLAGCEVSGTYADLGERIAEELPFPYHQTVVTPRSLTGLLLRSDAPSPSFVVELSRPQGALDARLWVEGSPGGHYRLPAACEPDGLVVELRPAWRTATAAAVRYWGELHLSRDAEGNLIGRLAFRYYGVFFLLPIAGNGTIWYRFAPQLPNA